MTKPREDVAREIDKIYWRTHNGCTTQKSSRKQAHDKAIEAIVNYLESEVLRVRIDELKTLKKNHQKAIIDLLEGKEGKGTLDQIVERLATLTQKLKELE